MGCKNLTEASLHSIIDKWQASLNSINMSGTNVGIIPDYCKFFLNTPLMNFPYIVGMNPQENSNSQIFIFHHNALKTETAHEIMVLFVLHKRILQTCMRSHPVGLDVWFLLWPFIYFHTWCVWTVKALARPRRCAGSPKPSLVACVISTIISWAGSIIQIYRKNSNKCPSPIFDHKNEHFSDDFLTSQCLY